MGQQNYHRKFPIKIFYEIIKALELTNNFGLELGTAIRQGARLGDVNLPLNSIEGIASRSFNTQIGKGVTKRSHVITSILVTAGICEFENNILKLRISQ